MNSAIVVQKLWNYCNVLRDDDMSYGDYVKELTYPLFLKMADERPRPACKQASLIPESYAWPALRAIAYHIRKRIFFITHGKSIGCNHNG